MATAVVMPKQGQSVESCIIAGWKKAVGDQVVEGDVLCEVETDKALLEVESPATGTLLTLFFKEGDDVPVLTNIAVVGEPGEEADSFRPAGTVPEATPAAGEPVPEPEVVSGSIPVGASSVTPVVTAMDGEVSISPRARKLAQQKGLDFATIAISGTGPGGRIIERDVQAALVAMPKMTPLAKSMVATGGYSAPARGSGLRGRIMSDDLAGISVAATASVTEPGADEIEVIPVRGIRKVIATRMLESLQTTAQLTLNTSADARAILAYRKRLKASAEELGLQKITINDLILFAVSRMLPQYPFLNARFTDDEIAQYKNVHLGVAVDTPRGLVVPVVRPANTLSLKQIAQEARRLAAACLEGTVKPDEITGGTFTVTNLGAFGIESFTPVLNPPEVGILGVGNVNLKPVEVDGDVQFIPHIGLSLTINHQVVDGAPAARFLQGLSQALADLELLLAL